MSIEREVAMEPAAGPAAESEVVPSRFTEAALERHKQEGLELAVRARWVAMAFIAVFLVFLNPEVDVLFYHVFLALLALNGWFIRRAGRVGRSGLEIFLILMDLVIMTAGMVLPNPLRDDPMPIAMQYRFDNFQYFFVILAAGTLAYSWRTVMSIGTWTAVIWSAGCGLAWWLSSPFPDLSERAASAFEGFPQILEMLDPNSFGLQLRIQEVVVFAMVALTLSLSVRRYNRLLLSSAALERERANLSRYFSPNVVDRLSRNDEPLKQVRSEDIAVLFVDIVDFTSFAAGRDPYEVVTFLRDFHGRMEAEVFRHHGTLDKYLGDGLMATFGTPVAGQRDASNALACARSMMGIVTAWNAERRAAGELEIRVGIGVHFGQAVLGDIGSDRLEYAVIGTSVNIAARLEAMTRELDTCLVISDVLRDQVIRESGEDMSGLAGLRSVPGQVIRGLDHPMTVWVHD